jgi:hypothetical protein
MKALLVLAALVALAGCPRRVVINPEDVPGKNSADWQVKSEPRAGG